MASEDEKHIAFVINKGIYCYKGIPFGFKNVKATYQWTVNKIFKAQIGRNMEVYVDDMLAKSLKASNHVQDLEEVFDTLRRY